MYALFGRQRDFGSQSSLLPLSLLYPFEIYISHNALFALNSVVESVIGDYFNIQKHTMS